MGLNGTGLGVRGGGSRCAADCPTTCHQRDMFRLWARSTSTSCMRTTASLTRSNVLFPTPRLMLLSGVEHPTLRQKPTVALGGLPREQQMLKGHLPRVIYHQVYSYTKTTGIQDTDGESGGGSRDWYFNAQKSALAPHRARPERRAALRIVLITVPRVNRSYEHFSHRFNLLPQRN